MQFQVSLPDDSLIVTADEGVVSVKINRPARKNAITQAMWLAMADIFRRIGETPDARVVVLAGEGADFCAGADIGEFETVRGNADAARIYEAANSAAFAAIRDCPVPTVAAIRGVCFGGGFGMAAACDLRIGATTATFSVPAARLGLAYPVDAMADIVDVVGPQMARYLTYSAARLDAAAALDAGFLLEIVEPGGLDHRVRELAAAMAANAPLSVRASKASIRAALAADPALTQRAKALGDATFESEDYGEGRAAFREKRKPIFAGR